MNELKVIDYPEYLMYKGALYQYVTIDVETVIPAVYPYEENVKGAEE